MKVSIAKALKIKARLAGEINRLRSLVRDYNTVCTAAQQDAVDTPDKLDKFVKSMRKTDVAEDFRKLRAATEKIIAVKIAIAQGNAGAQDILVRLAEAKGEADWIGMLDSMPDSVTPVSEGTVRVQNSAIKPAAVEKAREERVKLVEDLQDAIDEYNATHFVEIPD